MVDSCNGRSKTNDVIQDGALLLRHFDYVISDTLCGVSHAYGLDVGSLAYLVIPLVFSCGTVSHDVR